MHLRFLGVEHEPDARVSSQALDQLGEGVRVDVQQCNRASQGTNTNFDLTPYAFVFDGTGKMLWHGHPADEKYEQTVAQAVANLPG